MAGYVPPQQQQQWQPPPTRPDRKVIAVAKSGITVVATGANLSRQPDNAPRRGIGIKMPGDDTWGGIEEMDFARVKNDLGTDVGLALPRLGMPPRDPEPGMADAARRGQLEQFFRYGDIIEAGWIIGDRFNWQLNPQNGVINLRYANQPHILQYEFETQSLDSREPSLNDRNINNLYYIRLLPLELPSYHFWVMPGESHPAGVKLTRQQRWQEEGNHGLAPQIQDLYLLQVEGGQVNSAWGRGFPPRYSMSQSQTAGYPLTAAGNPGQAQGNASLQLGQFQQYGQQSAYVPPPQQYINPQQINALSPQQQGFSQQQQLFGQQQQQPGLGQQQPTFNQQAGWGYSQQQPGVNQQAGWGYGQQGGSNSQSGYSSQPFGQQYGQGPGPRPRTITSPLIADSDSYSPIYNNNRKGTHSGTGDSTSSTTKTGLDSIRFFGWKQETRLGKNDPPPIQTFLICKPSPATFVEAPFGPCVTTFIGRVRHLYQLTRATWSFRVHPNLDKWDYQMDWRMISAMDTASERKESFEILAKHFSSSSPAVVTYCPGSIAVNRSPGMMIPSYASSDAIWDWYAEETEDGHVRRVHAQDELADICMRVINIDPRTHTRGVKIITRVPGFEDRVVKWGPSMDILEWQRLVYYPIDQDEIFIEPGSGEVGVLEEDLDRAIEEAKVEKKFRELQRYKKYEDAVGTKKFEELVGPGSRHHFGLGPLSHRKHDIGSSSSTGDSKPCTIDRRSPSHSVDKGMGPPLPKGIPHCDKCWVRLDSSNHSVSLERVHVYIDMVADHFCSA